LIETTDSKLEDAPNDAKIWVEDVNLVNDIELVPRWEDNTEGVIFVTGVTGFVGAHLLQRLMEKPSVKEISCLARPKNGVSAATRVQQALERYDLWPSKFDQIQKLLVLEGDLGDRELGLGSQKFTWLEAMVRRMRDRGLPITIYRPEFIVVVVRRERTILMVSSLGF
jgi:thioester reductase-like protein